MEEKFLFSMDELSEEHGEFVGRKCANLGVIKKIGLAVPPGFALSVHAYKEFMSKTKAGEEIKEYLQEFKDPLTTIEQFNTVSKKIRQIVESKEMPENLKKEILENYRELNRQCGITDVAVSTRSAGPISHPGQYETHLNVKGETELLEKIKKVWSSSFNSRSLAVRAKNSLQLESDPIGVAVLKMINARAAGVLFTADPNTGDASTMIIEANWGLGESVVGGEVMPDIFLVDRDTEKPVKKTLGTKKKYITAGEKGIVEKDTPEEKRSVFCLSDMEISEIVRKGKALENRFNTHQDVEWAIDDDLSYPENIILLQTRAEVIAPKKDPLDQIGDLMMKLF